MGAANDNRLGDRLAFGVADAATALSVGQSNRRAPMADWAAYCRPGSKPPGGVETIKP